MSVDQVDWSSISLSVSFNLALARVLKVEQCLVLSFSFHNLV